MQQTAEIFALKPSDAPAGAPFSIDLSEFVGSLAKRIDGFLYRGLNSGDYAMIWVSSGFEAMIGTRAETFIAERRPFSDLIHRDDLATVNDAVAAALESGGRWQVFYRVRDANGQFRYVLETGGGCEPDPATGEVRYLDGIILDAGGMTDLAGRLEQGGAVVSTVAESVANIVETLRTLRLLALNARIEAARSGQHGAGFGVVAQEMVALADRGDEITSRIKSDLARLSEAVRI